MARQPQSAEASVLPTNTTFAVEGSPDVEFMDDLVAANRFKTFLIGRGIDVPDDVLLGLGKLSTDFRSDIVEYNINYPLSDPTKK